MDVCDFGVSDCSPAKIVHQDVWIENSGSVSTPWRCQEMAGGCTFLLSKFPCCPPPTLTASVRVGGVPSLIYFFLSDLVLSVRFSGIPNITVQKCVTVNTSMQMQSARHSFNVESFTQGDYFLWCEGICLSKLTPCQWSWQKPFLPEHLKMHFPITFFTKTWTNSMPLNKGNKNMDVCNVMCNMMHHQCNLFLYLVLLCHTTLPSTGMYMSMFLSISHYNFHLSGFSAGSSRTYHLSVCCGLLTFSFLTAKLSPNINFNLN